MDTQVKRKLGGGKRTEQPEPWKIEELVNARGEKIVSRFIATLQGRNSDEAKALLMVLAERGNDLGMPESKSLGQGLCELRGSELRIFCCFRPGRRIVLLDALLKKRTDVPRDVVDRLRKLVKRIE